MVIFIGPIIITQCKRASRVLVRMRMNANIGERSKMASLVFVVFLAGYVQSEYFNFRSNIAMT